MTEYPVQDAEKHLQKLIDEARKGQTVLIRDSDNNAVQLVPVKQRPVQRKAGSARGRIEISPDFDAPLSDFDPYS